MQFDTTEAGIDSDTIVALHEQMPPVLPPGTTIDRFVLLRLLGAGGMGVVHAAHDPKLDRRIALKLVTRPGDNPRVLREAQALARLAHPNVVTVHDVGAHEDTVWIAMELIEGQTLSAWAKAAPRSNIDVLRALIEAAHGVAAAHAAGLVHRDLKPDNVMVGRDGRVRVMDFGLAHGRTDAAAASRHGSTNDALAQHLTAAGALQGTPAYMAPEQWLGRETGPRADQFSWCVMAWELVYGERPFLGADLFTLSNAVVRGQRRLAPRHARVPGWLRRVLERGLSPLPEQRWPTMRDLLAAFQRGRRRARLKRVLLALAGLAVALLIAGGVRRWDRERTLSACIASGDEIYAIWNEDTRRRVSAALQSTDLRDPTEIADRVVPLLDGKATAWRRARSAACIANDLQDRWDADTYASSLACLDSRRISIQLTVDGLVRANTNAARQAVSSIVNLPALDPCLDSDALRRQPVLPGHAREAIRAIRATLERADTMYRAGSYASGLAVAREAHEAAEALAWPPLTATVEMTLARLLSAAGDAPEAERLAAEVYYAAARLGMWELAGDAATVLSNLAGYVRSDLGEGTVWARNAELALIQAGDTSGLREATRVTVLANVLTTVKRYAEARDLHERALAIRRRILGPDHLDVAWSLNNLANDHSSLGDDTGARVLHTQALAIRHRILGPDHPDVAYSLFNLGNTERNAGHYDLALALHHRAREIRERALGPHHPDVTQSIHNLGLVQLHRGDDAAARDLLERALAIREHSLGLDHVQVASTLFSLGIAYSGLGAYTRAQALLERALKIREHSLGPEHPEVARTLYQLGRVRLRLGVDADAVLRRALAVAEVSLAGDRLQVDLCRLGLGLGRLAADDPAEALPLLEQAVVGLADRGPEDEAVARFALARALFPREPERARVEAERARALRPHRSVPELAGLATWPASQQEPR